MRSANKGLKDKRSACPISIFLSQLLILRDRYRALLGVRITKTCTQPLSKLLLDSEPRVENSGEGRGGATPEFIVAASKNTYTYMGIDYHKIHNIHSRDRVVSQAS